MKNTIHSRSFFGIMFALLLSVGFSSAIRAGQTVYDSGDPTADEQYVLELVNRARKDPTAEGTRLKINISEGLAAGSTVVARPPLAMNKLLLQCARDHSKDMFTRSFFAHTNPDGKDPFTRIASTGYVDKASGENIAAGSSTFDSARLEDELMIDAGLPNRGHRVNLLNIGNSTVYREVGMGYFSSTTANKSGLNNFLTQDFGTATADTPFVVGVVYKDTNGNGFYDVGEGLSGVSITPDSGTFMAITGVSGGYAFPAATSGTIMITASGGALSAPITLPATLSTNNVKIDFISTGGGGGGGGGSTAPAITSSLNAPATVGTAFTYTITASGTAPITFGATSLPGGLTVSGATISGTPTTAGTFNVSLTATNSAGTDAKTLVITVAPNNTGTAPAITSSLSATATVGTAFTYTITASGSATITFNATPLPDGLSLSGATISGTPTKAGVFVVSISATNSLGKDTQSLTITIAASGGGGGPFVSKSNTDSDGDGFADEIETALGTSTSNKLDTPFGGAAAGAPLQLSMTKAQIKLNFSGQPSKDSVTLSGELPIPDAYAPLNKKIVIDVGGVVRTFILNEKAVGTSATGDSLKLKFKSVKGVVSAQPGTFSAKFLKGTFVNELSDEGLVNATVASNVTVPVIVLFENKLYSAPFPMAYKATAGKTGTAK